MENLVECRYHNVITMMPNPFPIPNVNENEEGHLTKGYFQPFGRHIYTVIETVVHYCRRSVLLFIGGNNVISQIMVPVAQHLCISMDDGISRYEEVLRVLNDLEDNTEYISVDHRMIPGDLTYQSKFDEVLSSSLAEVTGSLSDELWELFLYRVAGRSLSMDEMINLFFNSSKDPIQAQFTPLIQHNPIRMNFQMTAAPFALIGKLYHTTLNEAAVLLFNAQYQLFETFHMTFNETEHRIQAILFDSAISRFALNPKMAPHIVFLDAVSYCDTAGGLNLITNNERVPESVHPFRNFQFNPVLNPFLDPFWNLKMAPQLENQAPIINNQELIVAPFTAAPGSHVIPSGHRMLRPVQLPKTPGYVLMPNGRTLPAVFHTNLSLTDELLDNGHHSRLNPNAEDFYPSGFGIPPL